MYTVIYYRMLMNKCRFLLGVASADEEAESV